MSLYTVVTIELDVRDEDALFAAAVKRAMLENAWSKREAYAALKQDGLIDIKACLIMLLDPGTLDGCDIIQSSAETHPGA